MESYNGEVLGIARTVALGVNIAMDEQNFEGVERAMGFVKNDKRMVYVAITDTDSSVSNPGSAIRIAFQYPENVKVNLLQASNDSIVINKAPILNKEMKGDVYVAFSTREINNKISDTRKMLSYISIGVSLIAILLGILISRLISRPVTKLKNAALLVAEGNYEVDLKINTKDEFQQLAAAFQSMTQKLEKQHSDLVVSNKALESFTYSVSHDLRAPLRAINGYSKILIDDYGSRLDEDGLYSLNVVTKNAAKMGRLIDDLLAFSRLGKLNLNKTRVDINSLVHLILDEMKTTIANSNTVIKVNRLPQANGDASMLNQAFTNLISNAIKYSSKKEKPEVNISAYSENNYIVYKISDNGAGFNMEYYDKLFGVFQRLHSDAEFEGTGVGLALVQRIILKHGGKVWAEGKPGEGATFFISLPVD